MMPPSAQLNLGSGKIKFYGWLNVDLENSDHDVDWGGRVLPWPDGSFTAVVSRHLIEHLHLHLELVPLMQEIRRVTKPGGEVWLSCPDIRKACESYINCRMLDLLEDRKKRHPDFSLNGVPSSHFINNLFHQGGHVSSHPFPFGAHEQVLPGQASSSLSLTKRLIEWRKGLIDSF